MFTAKKLLTKFENICGDPDKILQHNGGSSECICPSCGNTDPRTEIPCDQQVCSKCGTKMTGVK